MTSPGDIGEQSYSKFMQRGEDGSRADAGHCDDVEVLSADFVPYGKLLMMLPTQRSFVKLPGSQDSVALEGGVSIFEQVIGEEFRFAPPFPQGYPPNERILMRCRGRIIVYPEQPVALLDPVFFRFFQLNPDGANGKGFFTVSQAATSGAWTPQVTEGPDTFSGTPLQFNFSALDLQNSLNSAVAAPYPVTCVVTGDQVRGFAIDWGLDSRFITFSLSALQNSLTAGGNPVLLNYSATQIGYPPGNRFGVGSFRKDSDFGSAADANAAGSARRFKWFSPSDQDGKTILEII